LNELVDRLAPIPGVVGILLFGSVAKGEADEYSDYDVLILFKDRASLRREWDSVFTETASMNLNVHAVPETMDELEKANPVFLKELEKHAKVLYARSPFSTRFGSRLTRECSVVSYDLSPLTYREKMRVLYRLYEGGGGGVVGKSGGMKLSSGCVLVPRGWANEVVHLLKSSGADALRLDVLLEEGEAEAKLKKARS
jgi:predicted nucleotidyltransferase